MPKITSVIGLGYLGVTQAAVLASLGHRVIGVDPDLTKIMQLRSGVVPFFEPGLQDLLKAGLQAGLLVFEDSISKIQERVDVHFLCVGTPENVDGSGVDVSYLSTAVEQLAPILVSGSTIVGRSTVPVGTASSLEKILRHHTETEFHLIWNPEFLSEGTAIKDSLQPERIVIGSDSKVGEAALREIYKDIIDTRVPVLSLDRQTSELVKVASNAFLALKISFINGVAEIAEKTGASTSKLADAMGLDSRIGRKFLNTGLGFGGGCLPKDLVGFAKFAEDQESFAFGQMLVSASQINKDRQNKVIQLAEELLGEMVQQKIAVLGASFKKDTDDVRNSPGIALARSLILKGANVVVHNPVPISIDQPAVSGLHVTNDLEDAVRGSSLVIITSDWDEYRQMSPSKLSDKVLAMNLIDGRSIVDKNDWASNGWRVRILGESQGSLANE